MRISLLLLISAGLLPTAPRIQVKLGGSTARDGRLIVVVSKEMQGEPRFQVAWGLATQQIFGKDVAGWKPGDAVEMGADTPGAPLHTLADLPPGTYNVQAVLNVYETFHRKDGRVLKLHKWFIASPLVADSQQDITTLHARTTKPPRPSVEGLK